MQECPFCQAALFPRQTVCPRCGARRERRRGAIGWLVLAGGILLLLGGLVLCAIHVSLAALAQIGLATAMLWFGGQPRQEVWRQPPPADR